MPAPITHMLVAEQATARLLADTDPELVEFATDVLKAHPRYMKLGSLGPDLPYFGVKSLVNPHKPIGVDQWSYQLHSKNPNLFPLQMIELVWRESNPRTDWADGDKCKFAFLCGFLTHVAADQIIHPLVNFIAGRYAHSHEAREEHRTCELHQDLYVLSQQKFGGNLTARDFGAQRFHSDCHIADDQQQGDLTKNEFLYFIQKAFVETHAVKPWLCTLKRRLFFLYWALWLCRSQNRWLHLFHRWYEDALVHLFVADGTPRTDSPQYAEYISLDGIEDRALFLQLFKGKRHYQDFLTEAIELAVVYIQAAHEIYRAPRADDCMRERFLNIVTNADLGVPLQLHILQNAKENLPSLRYLVNERWATRAARRWVALVDDRQQPESWTEAGEQVASNVQKEDLLKSVMATRESLGSVASRELSSARYVTDLPDVPCGEYVVVQFSTSFDEKQPAVENVIMLFDEDRTWRLFSYAVQ